MIAYNGSRRDNAGHPRVTVDDFMRMPRWFPSPSLAYRRHEAAWKAAAFRPNASGVSDVERIWRTEQRCRLLAFRGCLEVKPGVFPLLAELFRKPAVPAGFLLPEPEDVRGGSEEEAAARHGALQWLDQQPSRSVLYVALGTEAPVTAASVHELAAGLELSGARFLWGAPAAADAAGAPPPLPDGFAARCARGGCRRCACSRTPRWARS
jgi:hypothetical protein